MTKYSIDDNRAFVKRILRGNFSAALNTIRIFGVPLSLCSIAGNLIDFEVDILDLKAEYDLELELDSIEAVRRIF